MWVIFHKEFSESSEEEKISNDLAVLAVLVVNKIKAGRIYPHLMSSYGYVVVKLNLKDS